MGYMHIENLYKNQLILTGDNMYSLEKVDGSSAHIAFNKGELKFFAGGESQVVFEKLFNKEHLLEKFTELSNKLGNKIIVFGEVYGASCQKMSEVYGKNLSFIAFDIYIENPEPTFLPVPIMDLYCKNLGLEVVPWKVIPATKEAADTSIKEPSEVAQRRGMGNKMREGNVFRPLEEAKDEFGNRIIAKHKNDKFRETNTPRKLEDPNKLVVLEKAEEIAREWVTPERLRHVLQKLPTATSMAASNAVRLAMIEDVYREGKGEIVESKEASSAIGKKAIELFKQHLASEK